MTEVDKEPCPFHLLSLQSRVTFRLSLFSLSPYFQDCYFWPVEEADGDVRGADATAHIHRSLARVDHTSDFHGEIYLIFMYGQRSLYRQGNR